MTKPICETCIHLKSNTLWGLTKQTIAGKGGEDYTSYDQIYNCDYAGANESEPGKSLGHSDNDLTSLLEL